MKLEEGMALVQRKDITHVIGVGIIFCTCLPRRKRFCARFFLKQGRDPVKFFSTRRAALLWLRQRKEVVG